MSNFCLGGGIAVLQVDNTDCSCVSITSITNNGNGTFTITLSNGQATTLTIPQGESGTIAMQVANGYIQYSSNGGPWVNLVSLAQITGPAGANGANGVAVLYNDLSVVNNGAVTGTKVALKTFALQPNTLVANGAELRIRFQIEQLQTSNIQVFFSIANLVVGYAINIVDGTPPNVINGTTGSVDELHYEITISRTGSASGFYETTLKQISGNIVTKTIETIPVAIAPDFTVANVLSVTVISDVASSVNCRQLEILDYQFGNSTSSAIAIGGAYLNDAFAAAGGIAIGSYYINSATGAITQRLS